MTNKYRYKVFKYTSQSRTVTPRTVTLFLKAQRKSPVLLYDSIFYHRKLSPIYQFCKNSIKKYRIQDFMLYIDYIELTAIAVILSFLEKNKILVNFKMQC